MTVRSRRVVAVVTVVCVLAVGSAFAGPVLGAEAGGPSERTDRVRDDAREVRAPSMPVTDTSAGIGRFARGSVAEPERPERASWVGKRHAPFAQADDDSDSDGGDDGDDDDGDDEGETRIINVSAPGDNIEYTLSAPGLEPTDNVEVGENAEGAPNPEDIDGNTVSGTIGNSKHDAYEFTGSIEEIELESDGIEKIEIRIDSESVDPRTLTAGRTETTTATTTTEPTTVETATETTADIATPTETPIGTATETPTATQTATRTATTTETTTDVTTTATPTTTTTTTAPTTAASETGSTENTSTVTDSAAATATTAAGSPSNASVPRGESAGNESTESGFTLVMYVLIGMLTGLLVAASLAYAARSDRDG